MPGIICHFISYSTRVLNCDNGGFFSFAIAAINRVIQRAIDRLEDDQLSPCL